MTKHETIGVVILALLLSSLTLLPNIPQDQAYHQFADQRTLLGIPNALDTLSNAGFLIAGLWGIHALTSKSILLPNSIERLFAAVFFFGLTATAFGSGWYHLQPHDSGLAWDRLGMVITFSGVLGLAAAQKVSLRAGAVLGAISLLGGVYSVWWWHTHGNLAPYALVQFGGIALVLWFVSLPLSGGREHLPNARWDWLIGAYILAKILEALDQQVYTLTLETISGHSLKHLVAACAACAFVPMLKNRTR